MKLLDRSLRVPTCAIAIAATLGVGSVTATDVAAQPSIAVDKLYIIDAPGLSIKDAILAFASKNPRYKSDALAATKTWARDRKPLEWNSKGDAPKKTLTVTQERELTVDLAKPSIPYPQAAKAAGVTLSETTNTEQSDGGAGARTSVVGGESDPADLPVKGSSLVYSWSNLQAGLQGRYCRSLLGNCDPEPTDALSVQATIDTGVKNLRLTWSGLYFPNSYNFSRDHVQVFARYDGDDGTDISLSNDSNTDSADTGNASRTATFNFINPPDLSGKTGVFYAIKLWIYTPYGTYATNGARTAQSNCGGTTSMPTNNCVFQG